MLKCAWMELLLGSSSLNKHSPSKSTTGVTHHVAHTSGMGVSPWEKRGVGMCFGVRIPIHRSSESSFTGMEAKRAYEKEMGETGVPS